MHQDFHLEGRTTLDYMGSPNGEIGTTELHHSWLGWEGGLEMTDWFTG